MCESWQFQAQSERDTERLGHALADALQSGNVVALVGELGAGKTRLVQSVAERLGVERAMVTSPTFVLVNEYDGRLPIYHFDAYRLRDTDEFLALGADELLDAGGVCLIEWADRVADVLPDDRLQIDIRTTSATSRLFVFEAHGRDSQGVLGRLKQALESQREAD